MELILFSIIDIKRILCCTAISVIGIPFSPNLIDVSARFQYNFVPVNIDIFAVCA